MRQCLLLWVVGCLFMAAAVRASDVTPYVESLGIPFAGRYGEGEEIYARNVWDLQAFEGRLYIGAGNYDNTGPAPNAGPVPIMAWDPAKEMFIREGVADEEQIDRFEVINGRLYIPGTDPRENWDLGNLYRREPDGRWLKLRTIPRAIHTLALTGHEGRLYAGLGAKHTVSRYVDVKGYGSAVAVSEDAGADWRLLPLGGFRLCAFLHVQGRLYAVDVLPGPGIERWVSKHDRENYYAPVYELDSSKRIFQRRTDLSAERLFPETEDVRVRASVIDRVVMFGTSAVYTGSSGYVPFGLYRADSLSRGSIRVSRIRLPEETRPRDLLERDGTLFVLLDRPAANGGVQIHVLAGRDPEQWSEVLHFSAPTFARSFELLDGNFYFGLGCKVKHPSKWRQEELHPATGKLLRVKGKHARFPPEKTPPDDLE